MGSYDIYSRDLLLLMRKKNFFLFKPEDLFVQKINGDIVCRPPDYKNYKRSQCTPLFMNAYTMRNAGAVIHTHSKNCVMVTLLYPGVEFRITHQEMIKGIRKCKSGRFISHDFV